MDSWASLSEVYLRLNDKDFSSCLAEPSSLATFLISFFHELTQDVSLAHDTTILRKKSFLLLHRIWSGDEIPQPLLNWMLLSDTCHTYSRSEQFRTLLSSLWKRKSEPIEKSLQSAKASLIKALDSKKPENADDTLNKLGPLLKVSLDAAVFMLTGSDLLDSLTSAYSQTSSNFQRKLVTTVYLGLTALLEGPKPNFSLLSDHLYSLKTSAEQEQKADSTKQTLLADLVTNTSLLNKIKDKATTLEGSRVRNTAASLSVFQQLGIARPKRLVHRKVDKGKGKAKDDEYGHGAFGGIHVHRMSLVSQIQDLFPDLGSGFVVKLLDEYSDNVEEVTAHLLEDSLPPHLVSADRSEQL